MNKKQRIDWSFDLVCPFCGHKYTFPMLAYLRAMEELVCQPCIIECEECEKRFSATIREEFLVAKLADIHQKQEMRAFPSG